MILSPAYSSLTFRQVHERVTNVGSGLHALLTQILGVPAAAHSSRPAVRHVALYAETKAECMITMLGCFYNNIVVSTAYATLGLDALAYSLDLTDTRIVVTDEHLLPHLASIVHGRSFHDGNDEIAVDCSHINTIVYIPRTAESVPDAKALEVLKSRSAQHGGPIAVISFSQLEALGRLRNEGEDKSGRGASTATAGENMLGANILDAPERVPGPSSLAIIMFTSGTTG
jgi:long-subunit acyl-CoA synthetase (AMP-forming)